MVVFKAQALEVIDDDGRAIQLDSPPAKIVSLAPHLTEILFSLGVGDRIVATVKYADYPEAALDIPRLGDAFSLSAEAVIAISPDLILAWRTGGNQRTLQQIRELGYPIYMNEAETLEGIARTVERIGRLVGREEKGRVLAEEFRSGISDLKEAGRGVETRVFFQISDAQLYTINNDHLIGQALEVCGANNVFGGLSIPVPQVSLEAVISADPDVIIVASPHVNHTSPWQSDWKRFGLDDRIRHINASLITRPSLRMLNGIKSLCQLLQSR